MRWVRGTALAIGLAGASLGGYALAQQKPPPLDAAPPPAPAPQAGPAAGLDKFGEPLEPATPAPAPAPAPLTQAPVPAAPPPVTIPANELPSVGRFRALLGASTSLAYRSAEPIDPATGSVRLLGAVLTREGGTMTIEELTLERLGADSVGAASAREIVLTGGTSGTARIARLELRGLSAAGGQPDALVLDQLRLEALVLEGDQQVAIAEIELEDYGKGRPGRVTLAGIDVLAPQAGVVDRVRIGRVALRGLDLAAGIAALEAQEAPPRATAGYALEIEEVAATLEGRPVGALGALRVKGDPPAGAIEAGRLELRELRLEPFPGLADWLRRFGYPALVADLTAESRYDRAAGRLALTSLSLAGREMGLLGLSLTLDGVTTAAAEGGDWEQLALVGLTLRYLDQSLYGRAVRDEARRRRLPEARVREQWSSQLAGALQAPRGQPGALGPVVAALQRFLRGEAKEVEITAKPPKPVPFGDVPAAMLGGPAEAQRLLGLGAVAK